MWSSFLASSGIFLSVNMPISEKVQHLSNSDIAYRERGISDIKKLVSEINELREDMSDMAKESSRKDRAHRKEIEELRSEIDDLRSSLGKRKNCPV